MRGREDGGREEEREIDEEEPGGEGRFEVRGGCTDVGTFTDPLGTLEDPRRCRSVGLLRECRP